MERAVAKILKMKKALPTIKIVEHRNILLNVTSSVEFISISSMNVPQMGKQNPEHKGFLIFSFSMVICCCIKHIFDCSNTK